MHRLQRRRFKATSGTAPQVLSFVMTNDADRNEVIAFDRSANGTLIERNHFDTGGRGSGGVTDPLESQGSLTLSQDHSLLFAANSGSGTVSVFKVIGSSLFLLDKEATGGSAPVAVAQWNKSSASLVGLEPGA